MHPCAALTVQVADSLAQLHELLVVGAVLLLRALAALLLGRQLVLVRHQLWGEVPTVAFARALGQ